MANPFKEAEKAKKKPAGKPSVPAEKKEEVVVVETPDEKVVPEVKVEKVVKEPKKATGEKSAATKKKELLAGLNAEKESAHTYAFYLTDKNVEKLKAVAEEKNVSTSKLLDYILSEFL